jgi:hypothetical protein
MLSSLTAYEIGLVGRCLRAAACGPFFPDWEFDILFGLSRGDLEYVAEGWPGNAESQDIASIVRATLGNLWSYPHSGDQELARLIGAPTERIKELLDKLSPTIR